MNERRLSEIWIYPIKSLGGVQVSEANVMAKGLQFDRRWMLVDENNLFMTQRNFPRMALLKLRMENGEWKVLNGKDSKTLPMRAEGTSLPAKIWNDEVEVNEVCADTSEWFSDQLGMKCKLVVFPEVNSRPVDPRYAIKNDQVSLADGYPFLIIGQEALNYLNSKLEEPLPMNRFRPNFVFTGGEAHEEDAWQEFTIGTNRFAGVKPCARCSVPTVNQDTALKGTEPTRTLASYRKRDNNIFFGQNLLAIDHHIVRVGDRITIQSRR
jgi:hypothetical protein